MNEIMPNRKISSDPLRTIISYATKVWRTDIYGSILAD